MYYAANDLLGQPITIQQRRIADLAWAAGFIDGEGCISVVRQNFFKTGRKQTMRIRLEIMQNDLEVLERLKEILQECGRIYKVRRTLEHNRQVYLLTYDGEHALKAVSKVTPFLVRKAPQAQVILESITACRWGVHPGPRGYSEEVWKARDRLVVKLQNLK